MELPRRTWKSFAGFGALGGLLGGLLPSLYLQSQGLIEWADVAMLWGLIFGLIAGPPLGVLSGLGMYKVWGSRRAANVAAVLAPFLPFLVLLLA